MRGRPSRAARSGPSPDERELAFAALLERARQAQHVLALAERAETEESRSGRRPAHLRARLACIAPARTARGRRRSRSPSSSPGLPAPPRRGGRAARRDGDDRVRAAHREPRGRANGAVAARVLDVLTVGRDDERGPAGERAEQPRRDEEVRVDDIGPERVRGPQHVDREAGVAQAAPPRSTTARASSCPRASSACFERGDERAEVGASGPGYIWETSRMRIARSLER